MYDVLPKSLPQSEVEWLSVADFETGFVPIVDEKIRYALLSPAEPSERMVIMIGGVPRNPERQSRLPLINKLYGSIALQSKQLGMHSLMYQQLGTGKSSGDLKNETLFSRTEHLAELVSYFNKVAGIGRVSLIGMSLGSYLAARATARIETNGIKVDSLVLQSPAAYPEAAEQLAYGPTFTETISHPWVTADAPVFDDLKHYLHRGGRVTLSYFERDEPPIPKKIQEAYQDVITEAASKGLYVNAYSIASLEHNFRRFGSDHYGNVVHNGAVKAVANQISEFIS